MSPYDRLIICWALLCVFTGNTPCAACHFTNQRTAGTQVSRSVEVGDRQMQQFWWRLMLKCCFSTFIDRLLTDLCGLFFESSCFSWMYQSSCLYFFLFYSFFFSFALATQLSNCHRSSGCLATGSCLSQQVATMTVARRESGNKDIRCYFPLLVCGHFHWPPTAAVCVYNIVCVYFCSSEQQRLCWLYPHHQL